MNNFENSDPNIRRLMDITLAAKSQLKSLLPPSDYPDKLYEELRREFVTFLNPDHLEIVEKLFCFIEHDYRKYGLVGKGYHCLEHSLELALMILRSWRRSGSPLPRISSAELLEMAVAAILHDYDPHSRGNPPKVEKTLYVLKTDDLLRDLLLGLNLKTLNIALLIERTDYPFTAEKNISWEGKLILHFHGERERAAFRDRGEKLALFDKACTYFSLQPEAARQRVEGLADEAKLPKEKLLAGTWEFLQRENVGSAAAWVPDNYRQRWLFVERYFQNLAVPVLKD